MIECCEPAMKIRTNLPRLEIKGRSGDGTGQFKRTDLSRAQLPKCLLNEAKLGKAVFRGANFRKAKFVRANLVKADLSDCNLEKADFTKANLDNANLDRCNLEKTLFRNASLRYANLANADTSACILTGAETAGTVLQYVAKRAERQRGTEEADDGIGEDSVGANEELDSALQEVSMEDIDLSGALQIGEEIGIDDGH